MKKERAPSYRSWGTAKSLAISHRWHLGCKDTFCLKCAYFRVCGGYNCRAEKAWDFWNGRWCTLQADQPKLFSFESGRQNWRCENRNESEVLQEIKKGPKALKITSQLLVRQESPSARVLAETHIRGCGIHGRIHNPCFIHAAGLLSEKRALARLFSFCKDNIIFDRRYTRYRIWY